MEGVVLIKQRAIASMIFACGGMADILIFSSSCASKKFLTNLFLDYIIILLKQQPIRREQVYVKEPLSIASDAYNEGSLATQ